MLISKKKITKYFANKFQKKLVIILTFCFRKSQYSYYTFFEVSKINIHYIYIKSIFSKFLFFQYIFPYVLHEKFQRAGVTPLHYQIV